MKEPEIKTKPATKEYLENYDKIFGKKTPWWDSHKTKTMKVKK